jgi:hypothetical protein
MRHYLAAALFIAFAGVGCSFNWQANKASEAVYVDPSAIDTGNPVITPANGPGYVDGQNQDMRTK